MLIAVCSERSSCPCLCSGVDKKSVSRSDGLWRIQGTVWRKPDAVRTLQPASFKHKNNTLQLCSQQPKTNFGRLNNYIRFYLWKRKIPPTQRSDDFVGWIGGKMNQVCCGAVNLSGIIHGEAVFKMNTTTSCGWLVTNPQEQWDLQEKYHCMWKSSRGFWKIYGNKVERVGLLTAYFGFKWIKTVSGLFLRSGRCR